ncbi:MAG: DUF1003 domain-containing protein [Bacteroidota bacterium]
MIQKETLLKISIFQSLSEGDLELLSKLWTVRLLKKSEVLFRKGDSASSMFVIDEGEIEILVPDHSGHKEIRVSLLKEGDFFGELSLIVGSPRTATAAVMKDCRLLEMDRGEFVKFLSERPAVAISMISEIGRRLRATNDLVTSLASKNVNVEMDERLSFGDRLADKTEKFVGSWTFMIWFMGFLGLWVIFNAVQWLFSPFDAYPYVFLNLVLAVVSSLQAPLIMMSQNRAQTKDRLRAELDYQVNLKSELMLQQLHEKIDEIRSVELQIMQKALQEHLERIRKDAGSAESSIPSGANKP